MEWRTKILLNLAKEKKTVVINSGQKLNKLYNSSEKNASSKRQLFAENLCEENLIKSKKARVLEQNEEDTNSDKHEGKLNILILLFSVL